MGYFINISFNKLFLNLESVSNPSRPLPIFCREKQTEEKMQMSTTCPAVFTFIRVRSTEIRLNSSGHAAYLVEDKEPSSHCLPKGIFYLIKAINKSFI